MKRASILLLVIVITMIGAVSAQAGGIQDVGDVADGLQCTGNPPPPTILTYALVTPEQEPLVRAAFEEGFRGS